MKKKLFVSYSGGKDSHLTVYKALKAGYEIPFAFTFNAGAKHLRSFSDLPRPAIIKEHLKMMGIKCYEEKLASGISLKTAGKILKKARKIYYSSYTGMPGFLSSVNSDPADMRGLKKFCSEMKMDFLTLVDSRDFLSVLKECRKAGIKPLIVGIDAGIGRKWLGREAGPEFIKHLLTLKKKKKNIYDGNFQTVVADSPLFDARLEILDSEEFFDKADNQYMLRIKKYAFRKKGK